MLRGRESELAGLRQAIAKARGGSSAVVCIRGEAGIGKSALLDAAVESASGMTILRCVGSEFETHLSYSGIHQLLLPSRNLIDGLPKQYAVALRRCLRLQEGPVDDFAVCVALLALLTQIAEQDPLLLVVDDLQNLDPPSAAALLFVARRLLADPIAVLFAVRDPADLRVSGVPELPLRGLAPDAARLLLRDRGWRASAVVTDALVQATGGNPLALVECARAGVSGELAQELLLRGTAPLGQALRTVFDQRVAAMAPDAARIALVLAADTSGDPSVVLAAAESLGIAPESLRGVEDAELIVVTEVRVRFTNPLARSALYRGANADQRVEAHTALAAVLARRGDPTRAVHHRAMATIGTDDILAADIDDFADQANGRGDTAALAHLLTLSARLSAHSRERHHRLVGAAFAAWQSGQVELARETIAQIRREQADAEPRILAKIERLLGLMASDEGDPARAFTHLTRSADAVADTLPEEAMWLRFLALESAEHAGDESGVLRVVDELVGVLPAELRGTLGRWWADTVRGRPSAASADPYAVLAVIPTTEKPNDPRRPLMALALATAGVDVVAARAFGLELANRFRDRGMINTVAMVLNWMAEHEFHLGYWPDSAEHADEAARIAEDSRQPARQAMATAMLARAAALRGDDVSFDRLVAEADAFARPHGHRRILAVLAWARALRALADGDPDTALGHLIQVVDPRGSAANPAVARRLIYDLAEAGHFAGRPERIATALDEYVRWAMDSTLPWARLQLAAVRALDGGTASMAALLAEPELAASPFLHARVHLAYGLCRRRKHDLGAAHENLSAAERLFVRLGATPWARRAAAELRAIGGSPELSPGPAAVLTPQEQHVARLAARGLSNKEIAAEMFISPRTVGYHLYKIFPKLGISSRSQLRRLAEDGELLAGLP